MYEFVPTHKRTVFVSDCDPTPKMPFTPYKLRREHPELLPKVNVATTYEKYFDEIQAFSDDYGKSIWHVTFERRSPRVIDLERHSQIMAEVMNSFNRSRSGRALNITGCRLQNIRARNADFFFESWTFVVGKAAALMVASKFLDLHHVRLGGCEVLAAFADKLRSAANSCCELVDGHIARAELRDDTLYLGHSLGIGYSFC